MAAAITAARVLLRAGSGARAVMRQNAVYLLLALIAFGTWWLLKPYLRVLLGLVPQDTILQQGGGDVSTAFYARRKSAAARLHDTLTLNALSGSGRCEALYDALQWNDNELRLVHNAYKNAYGNTLQKALESTYTDDCSWMGMSEGLNEKLLQRLNTLGLV